MKTIFSTLAILLAGPVLFAQSIDKRINEWFEPKADAWEALVTTAIPVGSYNIPVVLILLIAGATLFTLVFSFVNIRRFPLAINVVRGKYDHLETDAPPVKPDEEMFTRDGDIVETIKVETRQGEVSHFQALTAAVSGTVGLGNIAGVAVAIAMGGPGATFWMIIAGLLGMSSKFVECTLGVKYRDVEPDGTVHGGPMYYLSRGLREMGFNGLGRFLAVVFAIFCVGASFGGGNAFQANQAIAQITTVFGLEGGFIKTGLGLVLAFLVGIVIIGGIKRIGNVTEKVVPFMAGLYVLAAIIIIVANFNYIDDALYLIINQAFTPVAGLGGMVGVIIVGFQRAAFSNEAGVGSAAIAHSAVKTKYPASEGVVALMEPFIDTVLICTMTALVIIFFNMEGAFDYGNVVQGNVLINETSEYMGGVDLTSAAFESVIPNFSYILTLAIVLFAFSTMLSWSYYGLQSWKFLFGRSKRSDTAYKVIFLAFIVIGAPATLDAVIKFSDAMILALVFPNMVGLIFLFPKVKEEMNRYMKAVRQRRDELSG
jgi:AGCS family alanine or glycine:cation symporter